MKSKRNLVFKVFRLTNLCPWEVSVDQSGNDLSYNSEGRYYVNDEGYMTNKVYLFDSRRKARAALALYRERCYL